MPLVRRLRPPTTRPPQAQRARDRSHRREPRPPRRRHRDQGLHCAEREQSSDPPHQRLEGEELLPVGATHVPTGSTQRHLTVAASGEAVGTVTRVSGSTSRAASPWTTAQHRGSGRVRRARRAEPPRSGPGSQPPYPHPWSPDDDTARAPGSPQHVPRASPLTSMLYTSRRRSIGSRVEALPFVVPFG